MNPNAIQNISLNELESKMSFKFQGAGKDRTMLPIDDHLKYLAIATNHEIHINDRKHECSTFSELFHILGLDQNPENLKILSKKFCLIEGDKYLPKEISRAMVKASFDSKHVYIKCWWFNEQYAWTASLLDYLQSEELLDVLPNSVGTFDVFDENCNWFMFLRDDDPFIFLAASPEVIAELTTVAEKYVMEIPRNFIYDTGQWELK